MALFSNLTDNGLEASQDKLGGFQLLESGVYPAKIKAAYAGSSQSGAMNITVIADINSYEYRETIYITNKEGKNYYTTDKAPDKKQPLPGFTTINDLCLLACGKPLSEMETEDKVLNVYSAEAGKEVPTQVPVLMDLLNKEIVLGIIKEKRYKSVLKDGSYVDSDEIREQNVINKVFHAESHFTVNEILNKKDSPEFYEKWSAKNTGVTADRTKGKKPAVSGSSAKPSATAPRKSLFS